MKKQYFNRVAISRYDVISTFLNLHCVSLSWFIRDMLVHDDTILFRLI